MKLDCVACEAFLAFHLLMFYSPFQLSFCCIFMLSSQNYLVSFFFNLVSEYAVLAVCLRPQYNNFMLSVWSSLPALSSWWSPVDPSKPCSCVISLHPSLPLCPVLPILLMLPGSSYVFELFLHSWARHFLRQMTVL